MDCKLVICLNQILTVIWLIAYERSYLDYILTDIHRSIQTTDYGQTEKVFFQKSQTLKFFEAFGGIFGQTISTILALCFLGLTHTNPK